MFRKLLRKLNNFRFTSIIMFIISTMAACYALASLFFYHFAHDMDKDLHVRTVGFAGTVKGAYLGMSLFFLGVIVLFISAYVAYSCLPFIKNKEKVLPRKGLLLAGFISGLFELALVIFMIMLAAKDHPNTFVGIMSTLRFGIISSIGSILYLVPFILCDFFMPKVKQ